MIDAVLVWYTHIVRDFHLRAHQRPRNRHPRRNHHQARRRQRFVRHQTCTLLIGNPRVYYTNFDPNIILGFYYFLAFFNFVLFEFYKK